jgi:hypothetical protein
MAGLPPMDEPARSSPCLLSCQRRQAAARQPPAACRPHPGLFFAASQTEVVLPQLTGRQLYEVQPDGSIGELAWRHLLDSGAARPAGLLVLSRAAPDLPARQPTRLLVRLPAGLPACLPAYLPT